MRDVLFSLGVVDDDEPAPPRKHGPVQCLEDELAPHTPLDPDIRKEHVPGIRRARERLERRLERNGYAVVDASEVAAACEKVGQGKYRWATTRDKNRLGIRDRERVLIVGARWYTGPEDERAE